MDPSKIPAKKAKKKPNKQKKAIIKKKKKVSKQIPIPSSPTFWRTQFNILPPHALPNTLLHISLTCIPYTIKDIVKHSQTPYKPFFNAQTICEGSIENPFTRTFHNAHQAAVRTCLRLRWIFRRLLHRWRVSRLSRPLLEDIVTCVIPKNEILIIDWTTKTATPFEATTLMRDITERLQLHDGFFEDPQPPRNPLTNLPLTQAQQISVWNSLSSSGIPCSAVFSEYRRVRWNFDRFCQEYAVPLQLRAFQMTMRDLTHIDTQERLLDFIEYAYDQESIDCSVVSYKYALQKHSDHPFLSEWAKLCTEFYSIGIVWARSPQKCLDLQNAILDKTIDLLDRQKQLIHLRNADLKLQRDTIRAERRTLRVQVVEVPILIADLAALGISSPTL